jgi:hypothetical protein
MTVKEPSEVAHHTWTEQTFMLLCLLSLFWLPLHSVDRAFAAGEAVGAAKNAIGGFTVVRSDGIEEQLEGKGALPLFEGDVLRTEGSSQAMIEFNNGIQVALNENTMFTILSRWEKGKVFDSNMGRCGSIPREGRNPWRLKLPSQRQRSKGQNLIFSSARMDNQP